MPSGKSSGSGEANPGLEQADSRVRNRTTNQTSRTAWKRGGGEEANGEGDLASDGDFY